MRIIDPPNKVIGESLRKFWQQSSELSRRFDDTEEGTIRFVTFVSMAVAQQLDKERG
jgi:hypothetical protein